MLLHMQFGKDMRIAHICINRTYKYLDYAHNEKNMRICGKLHEYADIRMKPANPHPHAHL